MPEFKLPIRTCDWVTKGKAHAGHRWRPTSDRRSKAPGIVWCPGVEELVVELERWAQSGTLEPTEGEEMSIAEEGAQAPLEQRAQRQGRMAYYAYGVMCNGEAPNGAPLPDWSGLPLRQQQAWMEAARAVRADTLDPTWANRTGADHKTAPWNRIERGRGPEPKPQ